MFWAGAAAPTVEIKCDLWGPVGSGSEALGSGLRRKYRGHLSFLLECLLNTALTLAFSSFRVQLVPPALQA